MHCSSNPLWGLDCSREVMFVVCASHHEFCLSAGNLLPHSIDVVLWQPRTLKPVGTYSTLTAVHCCPHAVCLRLMKTCGGEAAHQWHRKGLKCQQCSQRCSCWLKAVECLLWYFLPSSCMVAYWLKCLSRSAAFLSHFFFSIVWWPNTWSHKADLGSPWCNVWYCRQLHCWRKKKQCFHRHQIIWCYLICPLKQSLRAKK